MGTDREDSAAGLDADGLLSIDRERREIELAFARRLLNAMGASSSLLLDAARQEAPAGDVNRQLERLQLPVFAVLARALEADVTKDQGFGRFRGKD